MSTILFWCIRSTILRAKKPLNAGLIALPLIYGLTTSINVVSIVLDGPKRTYLSNNFENENIFLLFENTV